ncbi:MAG: serine hydrolase, partial [Planctomycetales bacterium]|nr:serine hydrolase [Planctomycetales bacterium]
MLGVAIKDGLVDLDAPASQYHTKFGIPPGDNAKSGWLPQVTLFHLATQTAGFDKPGGYEPLLFQPGTRWHYSDGGPNWLAECLTLVYRRDLEELMFERVFTPLGISRQDLRWRNNQYRAHTLDQIPRREFGAGIHANVEAMSRLGYLYLQKGRWQNEHIITPEFVAMASHPLKRLAGIEEWTPEAHGNASDHYSLLWWNNGDGSLAGVPRDAFWAWGLYDSLIVVIPSLDMVVVRGGDKGVSWPRVDGQDHYRVLAPFLQPIVASVDQPHAVHPPVVSAISPPYLPSTVITSVQWAPVDTIVRKAKGSDNWPTTWCDTDELLTAYGDGWGFEPLVEKKLSLGLAKISGGPRDFTGVNLRSKSIEQVGQGDQGKKASGILMVDGVLYLWLRNAENAQLHWSTDHGQTWTAADWKFKSSFGCPTFLNFGKNYAGARDNYVYVFSQDSDSAYQAADRMVLARVPKDQITARNAYSFYQGLQADGSPKFVADIAARGAVFAHAGKCYRSGITYDSGLKRYLWCQVLPESAHPQGPRFQGGFGIYDAPEPWGPWTTVFYTSNWDVGPGETSSLPTKWMSEDGKTVHLLFSGEDAFSVRQATLTVQQSANSLKD